MQAEIKSSESDYSLVIMKPVVFMLFKQSMSVYVFALVPHQLCIIITLENLCATITLQSICNHPVVLLLPFIILFSRSKEQKIGDVMAKLAPFLLLYTEYIKNYDNAMGMIGKWTSQSPKFAAILQEIQVQLVLSRQLNFYVFLHPLTK